MAAIKEDYVSFEIAKLLKEKGFKGEGEHFYENNEIVSFINYWDRITPKQRYEAIEAPTLQMAMKWLREKHLLHIPIDMVNGGRWKYEIDDISVPVDGGVLPKYYCDKTFSSYEEAVDDAIKYCLENLI